MEYEIFVKNDQSQPVASRSCNSDFAADEWAREWAASQKRDGDYIVRRKDGDYSASVFRTDGGQWYVMWLHPPKYRKAQSNGSG